MRSRGVPSARSRRSGRCGSWDAAQERPESGPATAPIARIKRIYRFHLALKAEKRQSLARALRLALAHAEAVQIPRRNLIVDVDAVNLM